MKLLLSFRTLTGTSSLHSPVVPNIINCFTIRCVRYSHYFKYCLRDKVLLAQETKSGSLPNIKSKSPSYHIRTCQPQPVRYFHSHSLSSSGSHRYDIFQKAMRSDYSSSAVLTSKRILSAITTTGAVTGEEPTNKDISDITDERGLKRRYETISSPSFIKLTKDERKIFRTLLGAAKYYKSRTNKKVILRVAGGWVRDKLLGISSRDIDIGVEGMTGHHFAKILNEYYISQGKPEKRFVVIPRNHMRSKYLETVIMLIAGMPIDFLNLRSADYNDSMKIPGETDFGSPYEDAHHRDFTINALFYNLHTNTVEDYTGRGVQDLQDGWIRTPLLAYQTFWQDPIRILRCVRFASQLRFQIADDAKQAILQKQEIRKAFSKSISYERVGREMSKILRDDAGRGIAIQLIRELDMYDVIFAPPETSILVKGTSEVRGERGDVDQAFQLAWIMEWLVQIRPWMTAGEDRRRLSRLSYDWDSGLQKLLKETPYLEGAVYMRTTFSNNDNREKNKDSNSNKPSRSNIDIDQNNNILEERGQKNNIVNNEGKEIELKNEGKDKDEDKDENKDDDYEGLSSEELLKRSLFLSTILYPYRNMSTVVNGTGMPASRWICLFRSRVRKINIMMTSKILQGYKDAQGHVNRIISAQSEPSVRNEGSQLDEKVKMVMAIRDIAVTRHNGEHWPGVLLFGLAQELIPNHDQLRQGVIDLDAKAKVIKYSTFMSKAAAYDIEDCYNWQPKVLYKDLLSLGIRFNRRYTWIAEQVYEWELKHPEATKEECLEWVIQNQHLFA
ncbi:hypothetical protein BCR41DRAFT_342383 [Lobosporangium transversale]|uniref:Poly A polymerase head domain-containing protein n=1 Tax=Lobosporangium transversale TaxID=64571 RepID=A0A1Y2G832_9FUNG|nr:hypothetical protein BCR41DRAFT_342383 [Lobosporangium transversale]ORZ02044.1 hypothetical protein BCR41DRAFT_342383 [Lobosporangium transversale]|eukprot:XP_021876272.1 hypothetical protein BCR41DRAFT_342383 [Lobosporangium transversale]